MLRLFGIIWFAAATALSVVLLILQLLIHLVDWSTRPQDAMDLLSQIRAAWLGFEPMLTTNVFLLLILAVSLSGLSVLTFGPSLWKRVRNSRLGQLTGIASKAQSLHVIFPQEAKVPWPPPSYRGARVIGPKRPDDEGLEIEKAIFCETYDVGVRNDSLVTARNVRVALVSVTRGSWVVPNTRKPLDSTMGESGNIDIQPGDEHLYRLIELPIPSVRLMPREILADDCTFEALRMMTSIDVVSPHPQFDHIPRLIHGYQIAVPPKAGEVIMFDIRVHADDMQPTAARFGISRGDGAEVKLLAQGVSLPPARTVGPPWLEDIVRKIQPRSRPG